ncbi:MAG: protease-like activity factor CPAF [Proteobacteria bacterium]|nr:protease-like activity factor CPAF [Pseudomonadota bacterium]
MIPRAALAAALFLSAVSSCRAASLPTSEQLESILSMPAGRQGQGWSKLFDGAKERPGAADAAAPANAAQKEEMLRALDFIRGAFKAQYAPRAWKEGRGWSLEREIERAKADVRAADAMSVAEYQKILKRLIASANDYHVDIRFARTEAATLPFKVAEANGRYFIVWIDRKKLPESSFPFHIGDELVSFGGKSPAEVVRAVAGEEGGNVPGTDAALATLRMTSRSATQGLAVPRGPIVLTIRRRTATEPVTHQIVWDYKPERVTETTAGDTKDLIGRLPFPWMANMIAPAVRELMAAGENPYGLGVRESYLPAFGAKIWETADDDPFHAYIYRSPADGKLVGYVRIPTYSVRDAAQAKHLEHFAKVVNKFQATTDGMVIDQLNNPGGSVFYLLTLASMLTDTSLGNPRHRIALAQTDVSEAVDTLTTAEQIQNDEQARRVYGSSFGGYPMSYEFVRHLVEFSRFLIEQWQAGKRLSDPTHLYGVDRINPSPAARYTKPILVLINELDFSGGDFFPAILQDNKRAVMFGARTAGAGGFVREVKFPNLLGVSLFTVTGSIAERADGNPIENLGVSPDVPYRPTADDLQGGYKGYVTAVHEQMAKMLAGR